MLTRRLNTELISATWDDLLRVAASVKYGHATAALVGRQAVLLETAAERADQCDQEVRGAAAHSVDIHGELAQLDTDGYRPLRLTKDALLE